MDCYDCGPNVISKLNKVYGWQAAEPRTFVARTSATERKARRGPNGPTHGYFRWMHRVHPAFDL